MRPATDPRLRRIVDAGWDADDVERGLTALRRRRRRRALWRGGAAALAVGLLALGGFRWSSRGPLAPPQPAVDASAPAAAPRFTLDDGSSVTGSPEAELALLEQSSGRVRIRLERGEGHFDVVPSQAREFQVSVGEAAVTVLGTVFSVDRRASRFEVAVERGRVRVALGGVGRVLTAGEHGSFPLRAGPWLELARQGHYLRAYEALAAVGPELMPQSVADLLLAADAARFSGHADQAERFLREAVREHPADPQSALAAFSLGRLLLFELHRPAEAADAFARAGELDEAGTLGEDALAREVEAWTGAGRADLARERSQRFSKRYPTSKRGAAVRRLGEGR